MRTNVGIRRGGLVVRASAFRVGGRGFDPRSQQTNVKTGSNGFPFGAQDYGNSTTIDPPVSG